MSGIRNRVACAILGMTMLAPACSVKEDRFECPVYVTVLTDQFVIRGMNEGKVSFSSSHVIDREDISFLSFLRDGYRQACPREYARAAVFSGAENYTLVEEAMQVIPGPSAVISALAISGQDTTRFCFEGFLSVTKKQRFSHLESLRHETRTMVFYEAPHKLLNTLKDMLEYFGDRSVSVCRELTKIHEEMMKTTLSEAVGYYETNPPRGEFVLVIAGEQQSAAEEKPSLEAVLAIARERIAAGERAADVCKQLASETGYPKRVLYQAVISD